MDDRWLSMREICEYLGVGHDTISRWIAKDMPAMKMGDRWKFKRDLVETWLQDGGLKKSTKKLCRNNREDAKCQLFDDMLWYLPKAANDYDLVFSI